MSLHQLDLETWHDHPRAHPMQQRVATGTHHLMYLLMVLVALHWAGVTHHQFIRRDGLLQRLR